MVKATSETIQLATDIVPGYNNNNDDFWADNPASTQAMFII